VLWHSNSGKDLSVMEELKILLSKNNYMQELRIIDELTSSVRSCDSIEDQLVLVRYGFLMLSHHVKSNHFNTTSNNKILSDILYMYAFTHHYFTPHEYDAHSSEEMIISPK
jgi:hypothetical protein